MASKHNGNQRMSIKVKNRKKCKGIKQAITQSLRMWKCEQMKLKKLQIRRAKNAYVGFELKQSFNILSVSIKPTTKNSAGTTTTTAMNFSCRTKTMQTPILRAMKGMSTR